MESNQSTHRLLPAENFNSRTVTVSAGTGPDRRNAFAIETALPVCFGFRFSRAAARSTWPRTRRAWRRRAMQPRFLGITFPHEPGSHLLRDSERAADFIGIRALISQEPRPSASADRRRMDSQTARDRIDDALAHHRRPPDSIDLA